VNVRRNVSCNCEGSDGLGFASWASFFFFFLGNIYIYIYLFRKLSLPPATGETQKHGGFNTYFFVLYMKKEADAAYETLFPYLSSTRCNVIQHPFIVVSAVHVSCGFSAHHQELKNCTCSIGYLSKLFAVTYSLGE